MSGDAEWGPWVDHDGMGCPVQNGVLVNVCGYASNGQFEEYTEAAKSTWLGWVWSNGPRITRYRIRKPRALLDLITLAADPYAPPPVIGPDSPVRVPEQVPA
jgi:cellulase/cellobiase CelA1